MLKRYEHTIYASYFGYITQAIVNNLAPLFFLTFRRTYGLSLQRITLITTVNFLVQLLVDLISAKLVDRVGYRIMVVGAHICCAAGLAGMAVLPMLLGDFYTGLMLSVVIYAIGGGLIEVLISPIVESCPTEKKEAAMSLLHSFYCWGHAGVILLSTLFFTVAGLRYWRVLTLLWAVVPLCNAFYFSRVPLFSLTGDKEPLSIGRLLKNKVFWLLVLLMICAGASEQAMSQWASSFAESALGVSKTLGDLMGPGLFAVTMGSSRALYGKFSERLPLKKAVYGSAVLCILCYLLAALGKLPVMGLLGCALCGFSVGIFWPGTFSLAARVLPGAGTAMYAFLALGGDVGCAAGPTLVGMIAGARGDSLKAGLLFALVFPVLILVGMKLLPEGKGK